MSPTSGHIARFDEFEAVSDEAALIFARSKLNAHAMELWEQHRKIERFEPRSVEERIAQSWADRQTG